MTERGLPIAEGASACPFVAFDDARDDRADRPDPRHRCYAESPPSPRARAHQEAYCLSASFPVCPTFQDWARREAARVLPFDQGGSPAERLRDVPAQREQGSRPPAFGPESAAAGGGAAAGTGAAAGGMGAAAGVSGAAGPLGPEGLNGDAIPGQSRSSGGTQGGEPYQADVPEVPGEPWDLPPRRPVSPDWSAPPPWAPSRGSGSGPAGDEQVAAPGLLRSDAQPDVGAWSHTPPGDESDLGSPARTARAERDAAIARLRGLGIGDPVETDEEFSATGGRPLAGVTRSIDPATGRAERVGQPAVVGAVGAAGAGGVDGTPAGMPEGGRSSGGFARALGWDRRPRAGGKPARRVEREPAWERPRRMEAYPTLKTRVGFSAPSRVIVALIAVLVAAAILFFVPPLLLRQSGGGDPGATRTPGASDSGLSGSAAASVAPTARPTPKQRTYTVKQGDVLSTIAKRFGVTVDEILAANKQIKDPNKIAIGDVLVIPTPLPSDVVDGGASGSP